MRVAAFALCLLLAVSGRAGAAPPAAVPSGMVIFYQPSSFGGSTDLPISVGLPAGNPAKGRITSQYKRTTPGAKPACGSAGSATFTLPAGWYPWLTDRRCPSPQVTEGGAIQIQAGACLQIALAELWGCPLQNQEAN